MKRINIFFILLMLFTACEDYLELAPELEIDESDVFTNYESAQGYLDNCYRALNDPSSWDQQKLQRGHVAALSDEASSTYPWSSIVSTMNKGDWFGKNSAAEIGYNDNNLGKSTGRVISNAFYCIRVANKILANVPGMTTLSDAQKNELIGQAYFFRAWYYFDIIKRWGGMPIFDHVFVGNEQLDIERKTYQESTEWMITDLDKAIELLPNEWADANTGRANKVAAMAVKSMATLYAASPLMNNGLDQIVDNGYNQEWSEKAAEYANDVLDYIETTVPSKGMMGEGLTGEARDSVYTHIFYHFPNFVSDESLWYKNSTGAARRVDMLIHFLNIRFGKASGNYGWATTSPSQNLVDKFEMVDGSLFDWNNPEHAANPYENRDPRFYNNILYPGEEHGIDQNGNPMYLSTWDGGADLNSNYMKSIPTGYMCKKWWWPEANGFNNPAYNLYYYNAIYIRTTQIYLDYAEAMNEAYGPDSDPKGYGMTAVDAINRVRARVGMPNVLAEFTGSKEAFRDRIRNERAVELMFESGHRWFDIRRWMIAEDLFSDVYPIKGVHVVDLTPGTSSVPDKEFSYEVKDVTTEVRVFERKHYWYPVAKDHIERYTNFKQNPGW